MQAEKRWQQLLLDNQSGHYSERERFYARMLRQGLLDPIAEQSEKTKHALRVFSDARHSSSSDGKHLLLPAKVIEIDDMQHAQGINIVMTAQQPELGLTDCM